MNGMMAVFNKAGADFDVRECEVKDPAAGYALLSLTASGICGTDIHIADGRLPVAGPAVIGHEFIGIVEKLGHGVSADGLGSPITKGDTVIACIALPCGECVNCRKGETASCLHFSVTNAGDPAKEPYFHGGFAEYLHQPAHTLVKVPSGVDPIAAAAFPCAGPTAIRSFTYAGGLEDKELVVVQGLGPVGLFAVAWAAKQGCHVVAIGSGRSPERIQKAKDLGADVVFDYHAIDMEERKKRILEMAAKMGRGNGADVVFEASGAPSAIPEGMDLLRTRGRYLIPGQYSLSGKVQIHPEQITFKALQLIGSGQYTMNDIATYLDFLKNNSDIASEFGACVTGRYCVRDVNNAIMMVREGKGIKTVFCKEN